MCSLARALEGPLRVAGEARVDAPVFAGPRSSSQVSVRTTPSGWRAWNRLCALDVLTEGILERATSACCGRPGSGVRRDYLCPRALSSLSADMASAPSGGSALHAEDDVLLPWLHIYPASEFLQEWIVPLNQSMCDCY